MQIEIQLTTFYSQGDERRFFQGLNELDCISNVKGIGRGLVFDVRLSQLTKEKLRELIGLLWRYQIDLLPLRPLVEKNKKLSWASEPHNYWHQNMFGDREKLGDFN